MARYKENKQLRAVQRRMDIRRSSATTRHTPRPRKGTRQEAERQAIRDQKFD